MPALAALNATAWTFQRSHSISFRRPTKVNKTIDGGKPLTTRAAFDKGTSTFNAHDMNGFAQVLSDDVVFEAPGGVRGAGKAGCVEFFGGWLVAFPDARINVHSLHILDDVAVEEGAFTGTHHGVLRGPM